MTEPQSSLKNIIQLNIYLALAMVILFGFSCAKQNESPANSQENIVGFWVNPQYGDSTILFDRADQLIKDDFGLALHRNNELTERKNIGWCGTPPISFGDYKGNWSKDGDKLNITVGFWGGIAIKKWQIQSVTDKHLEVKILEENYIE